MKLDATVRAVLDTEGSATFVTSGPDGPHLVATWQSYLEMVDEESFAFPAGGYRTTEANLERDPTVQMIIAEKHGPKGAVGFRLTGTAEIQVGTPVHDRLKVNHPWCRAAVMMRVDKVERILG